MKKAGFTLLELSIVIVIIGLIVAGISAGQSLVKQAQVRSVVSEMGSFPTILNSFKLQYDALPGDLANAYDYWGGTCGTDTVGDATACNGDGNKFIDSHPAGGSSTPKEDIKAWQHLSLAGIMDGSFTGTEISGSQRNGSENTPESGYTGGLIGIYREDGAFDGYGTSGNVLAFAGQVNGKGPWGQLFVPAEALSIDTKVDDGIPYRGTVYTLRGQGAGAGQCVDGTGTASSVNMELDDTTNSCRMFFWYEKK